MRSRNPLAPAWACALPPVLGAGVVVGLAGVLVELFDGDDVGFSGGVAASGVIVGAVVAAVLLPGRLRRAQHEVDAAQPLRGLPEQNRATAVRAPRRGPVPGDDATRSVALRLARAALADRTENLAWSHGVTGLALAVVDGVALVQGGGWWLLAAVVAVGLIGDEMGRARLRRRARALEPREPPVARLDPRKSVVVRGGEHTRTGRRPRPICRREGQRQSFTAAQHAAQVTVHHAHRTTTC